MSESDGSHGLIFRRDGDVAVLTMDDGKANALSEGLLAALDQALDRVAAEQARAVLVVGRPGRFSAGFDLNQMTAGMEPMRALVRTGALLLTRLFTLPVPVVAACTGHALAAGALLLLAADTRIGADGDFKIGLNEVAIGMGLPIFGVELARARLSPRHFTRATLQAQIYDPAGAVEAGYLDEVVAAHGLLERGLAEARRLGQLRAGAYQVTKAHGRDAVAANIRQTLDADLASVASPAQ